ncbi:MAG: hypothetical protein LBB50_00900 [Oscillospiraceae bacterium]|jgi:DNA-directed RNA polymerase specialized sigma subunit|nr:hypothetical protein [Oscillospiraceae bacterium]
MNQAAVGVGSWLLRSGGARALGLDAGLTDACSFAQWQAAQREDRAETEAFHALVREIWEAELDHLERTVLRGVHLEGKSEAAVGRQVGLHHSTVKRCRLRAEAKLRRALQSVLRYRALVAKRECEN